MVWAFTMAYGGILFFDGSRVACIMTAMKSVER